MVQPISEGESIRVTTDSGKWVILKTTIPKIHDNVRVILEDLDSGRTYHPVEQILTKFPLNANETNVEVKYKMAAKGTRLHFRIICDCPGDVTLTGQSVVFATHNSGKSPSLSG